MNRDLLQGIRRELRIIRWVIVVVAVVDALALLPWLKHYL